ncbi:MAG: ArsR/SmtB family transcription factor [Candidatus Hodarchaeales archaeon]
MNNDEKDTDEPLEEEEEFDDLKKSKNEKIEENGDFKEEFRTQTPRRSKSKRKRKYRSYIHTGAEDWEDWGEKFGSTLEHYIGGILDSVGDTIDRTIGSIFQTHPSYRSGRKKRRKEPYFVPDEEMDEFFQKGAAIMGALSDQTRLRMLKELERQPLRQSDLSEKTNTRGGNFKHHITILKDEGLVRQEGVRERYLLTFSGREALKLVEFLYSRTKKRIPIPVYSDEEEQEEFPEEEE